MKRIAIAIAWILLTAALCGAVIADELANPPAAHSINQA